MIETIYLMGHLFRFKIPRRWKLRRRGHSPTIVPDATEGDTAKGDMPPTSAGDTPKKDTTPAKTEAEIQLRSAKTQLDYFWGPWWDFREDDPEANAKPATKIVILPLEEMGPLETRLFTAQLNQGKIKELEEKVQQKSQELVKSREAIDRLSVTIQTLRKELEETKATASKDQ